MEGGGSLFASLTAKSVYYKLTSSNKWMKCIGDNKLILAVPVDLPDLLLLLEGTF